jgi:8-oxo-dGTP diphosphatase
MPDNHLISKIGQYALISNEAGEVLVLERVRSKSWCLPGGRLNENELWDDALLRELKEEVGLDCTNPKPVAVNLLKDDYQTKYSVYFTVDCLNNTLLKISAEHSKYLWIDIDRIEEIDFEDIEVKKVVKDYFEKN